MTTPAYSLQITEEGLERLQTTGLDAVRLICETIVTVAQAESNRSLERVRIESNNALAIAKIETEGRVALAKAEGDVKLAVLRVEGENSLALHNAGAPPPSRSY